MPVSTEELRSSLHAFDFRGLFVEGLGWNHYWADPFSIQLDGREYMLTPITEKAGFVVHQCVSLTTTSLSTRFGAKLKVRSPGGTSNT